MPRKPRKPIPVPASEVPGFSGNSNLLQCMSVRSRVRLSVPFVPELRTSQGRSSRAKPRLPPKHMSPRARPGLPGVGRSDLVLIGVEGQTSAFFTVAAHQALIGSHRKAIAELRGPQGVGSLHVGGFNPRPLHGFEDEGLLQRDLVETIFASRESGITPPQENRYLVESKQGPSGASFVDFLRSDSMRNLLRLILLIGATVPVVTVWIWQERVSWVQDLQASWCEQSDAGLEPRWKELREALPGMPMDEGIESLQRLLDDCGPVALGDRQFFIWRGCVGALARQLGKADRSIEAAELLWGALDRDPHNMAFVDALASALLGAGEVQASQELLGDWLEKLPGHPALLEQQMRIWLKLGQARPIEKALTEQLPRSLVYWKHGWRLRALGAGKGDVVTSPSWSVVPGTGTNSYSLSYAFAKVPEALSKLRMSLPAGFRGRLEAMQFSLTDEEGAALSDGVEVMPIARGLQSLENGVFQAASKGGAHLEWSWPEPLNLEHGLTVQIWLGLEASVHPDIMDGLRDLTTGG